MPHNGQETFSKMFQEKGESFNDFYAVRSFCDLELINDDCLRHIFRYMQILDVVNLAATCRRLQDFATAVWFPKNLESKVEINNTNIKFIAPTKKVSEYNLTPSFRCIGEYVEDLTFGDRRGCTDTMRSVFEHFKNLSSLTFTYYSAYGFKSNDFAKLFTNNAHCLKHLNLSELRFVGDKESVYELIVEKLPNLETLELMLTTFDDSFKPFIDLSHLTTLNVFVLQGYSVNSILQTLSNNGVIEDLTLRFHEFYFENRYLTPLVFNKLKSLTIRDPKIMKNFFERMAHAHMPVITDFKFYGLTKQTPTLVEFIGSKRTLSNCYMVIKDNNRFQLIPFWHKLIDALKVHYTPERAILQVMIPHNIEEQKILKSEHPQQYVQLTF